jgi:hypothetical protein
VEIILNFVRVNILGTVDDARADELEKIMAFLGEVVQSEVLCPRFVVVQIATASHAGKTV